MRLSLFVSRWTAQHMPLPDFFNLLEMAEVAGAEMSLQDLGPDVKTRLETCKNLRDRGLRLILGLYSSWVDYEETSHPRFPPHSPENSVDHHVRQLIDQIRATEQLPIDIAHINIHGGDDLWSYDQKNLFFEKSLKLFDSNHRVSFETHRGRCLHHPRPTIDLLRQHPKLRITADLSHWHVACERVLGAHVEEREWLHAEIAPRILHIHARVGSDQNPQESSNYKGQAKFRDAHTSLWTSVWEEHRRRGEKEVLMTPELGPPPYQHGENCTPDGLWSQTIEEISFIKACFFSWLHEISRKK